MLDQDHVSVQDSAAAHDHLFDPEKHAELIEEIKKLALKNPDALKDYARGAFAGKEGDKLVQQVADSQAIVNNVKAAFVKIGATLVVIDGKKLVLQGKPVPEFAGKWHTVLESFDSIMKDSQKVAARAAHTAQQFADVLIGVLLDPDTTKPEAHEVLTSYKKEIQDEQEAAVAVTSRITELHQSITNFSATLVDALGGKDAGSAITIQIEELRKSIYKVNERIEGLQKLINGCMWSAIGGGIGLVAGVLLTMTPLAPIGIALVVGSVGSAAGAGIAAASWADQVSTAENERNGYQAQLDELIKTQRDLNDVQGRLGKLDGEWTTIYNGLAAISAIWGAFGSSLIEIEKSLEAADKNMMKDGKIWQKMYLLDLKLLEAIYGRLAQMLNQWSANITAVYEPNAPAPPYEA